MRILDAYGIPEKLVKVITIIYETPDGDTTPFKILAGVLQGDTLAPYLFAIVIDYVMRQAIENKEQELGFRLYLRKSKRIPATVVTDLMFADDIAF